MSRDLYPLVDRVLRGRLEEILRKYRAQGLSYRQIAARLWADHELDLSDETVRQWCLELEIETPA